MKRTAQFLLLLLAAGLIAVLIYAPKPWQIETLLRENLGFHLLLRDQIAKNLWTGAAISLVAVGLLIVTAEAWVGSRNSHRSREGKWKTGRQILKRRWVIGTALATMIGCGFLAYPRLSHSLWGDEDYTVRLHLHGHFKRDVNREGFEDGRPYFRPLNWRDTVFGYPNTNNHFLYTIVARATSEAWQRAKGVPKWVFSEVVLRAWPFAFGLLSIGAWMMFASRVGLPRSIFPFAVLIWCNPWFIRYITEARGYAFILLFLPLSLIALINALDRGSWRQWLLYGLLQFLMLYSWPGLAIHVVAVNLCIGGYLLFRDTVKDPLKPVISEPERTETETSLNPTLVGGAKESDSVIRDTNKAAPRTGQFEQFWRWGVVNLLVVIILLPLILPTRPQVKQYVTESQLPLPINTDSGWVQNFVGYMSLGTPTRDYYKFHPGVNPHYFSIDSIARDTSSAAPEPEILGPDGKPVLARFWPRTEPIYLYVYTLLGLGALGLIVWCIRARHGMLIMVPVVGAGVAFWCYGHFNEKYLFPWYFVYLQPVYLLLVSTGLVFLYDIIVRIPGFGRSRGDRSLLAVSGIACLGVIAFYFSWFKLSVMREHSIDPLRESVLYTRHSLDPDDPRRSEVLTAHLHFGAFSYDAHAFPIDKAFSKQPTIPGITKLMRTSDAFGVPLYINIGYPIDARSILPDLMNIVDDQSLFEAERVFWSSEPQLVREVFRYKGGFFPPFPDTSKYPPAPGAGVYGDVVPKAMIKMPELPEEKDDQSPDDSAEASSAPAAAKNAPADSASSTDTE